MEQVYLFGMPLVSRVGSRQPMVRRPCLCRPLQLRYSYTGRELRCHGILRDKSSPWNNTAMTAQDHGLFLQHTVSLPCVLRAVIRQTDKANPSR